MLLLNPSNAKALSGMVATQRQYEMTRQTIARNSPARNARPRLVVTVDTEEEGLWGGEYRREGNTVENIRGVPRFQQICDSLGVRPTYLVDTPVAASDEAVAILRPLQDEGRAEIGAHLHPWCAPPFDEPLGSENSYQCNLPVSLQREKLHNLTGLITKQFGSRPVSFRAGRYGLDVAGARLLEELGYRVDSSVVPFYDYAPQHGPDFRDAPHTPYHVGHASLCQRGEASSILEVPVSTGYTRGEFNVRSRWRAWAASPALRPLHMVGILDRLGLARRVKFSPEQASAAEMRRLVDAYVRQRAPVMVMMLHSSSLSAGHSPYAADAAALEKLLGAMTETIKYCCEEMGMPSQTLAEFAQTFA
ncbi:MAG: polysaccharide deacetylase family protein [Planctomycetales bacterium]|nr:polysaccharide deacetylase family protein [Planctomycetales bacterium]